MGWLQVKLMLDSTFVLDWKLASWLTGRPAGSLTGWLLVGGLAADWLADCLVGVVAGLLAAC